MPIVINDGYWRQKTETDYEIFYPKTTWENIIDKPSNFVTLDTEQTITGEKHFENRVYSNSEFIATGYRSAAGFGYSGISLYGNSIESPDHVLSFPQKSGTIALVEDFPDTSNFVTLDTEQTISANKFFSKGTSGPAYTTVKIKVYDGSSPTDGYGVEVDQHGNVATYQGAQISYRPYGSSDVYAYRFPLKRGTILLDVDMGIANGVASLDGSGKVPASQLPSYVDDVEEYGSESEFPATGESGKIYVATDTNLTYRWSGTKYVEISQSLGLGETASTAYPGDKGKENAAAITALEKVVDGLSNGVVRYDINQLLSDAQQQQARKNIGAGEPYTLPQASSSALGGIMTGFTDSGNDRAVKVDKSGNAYVTVPNVTWDELGNKAGGDLTGTYPNPIIKAGAVDDTKLSPTGVAEGYYSVVQVNEAGRVLKGAQIFMAGTSETMPAELAIGGLYFYITGTRTE